MPRITTQAQLRNLYGPAHDRAVKKQLDYLHAHSRRFIALSPFCALSSMGADGRADVSPRGEKPGFVHVLDDHTLAIPDRPGNNRLDTLTNIIANPNVGLMFLVPGINEMLRVNGTAELRDDEALKARFAVNERAPRLVIVVSVQEAYIHCAKAIMRSSLWDEATRIERAALPSIGEVLRDQIGAAAGPVEPEHAMLERYKSVLY